eukprot:scaffold19009_cov98-Isochrysis_galbana.AAC.11
MGPLSGKEVMTSVMKRASRWSRAHVQICTCVALRHPHPAQLCDCGNYLPNANIQYRGIERKGRRMPVAGRRCPWRGKFDVYL